MPSGAAAADGFPQLLSQTGCVDPKDPTKPAAGLIPYDVNSPLWSDGAEKQRYFAIPDGKTITITADQDWDLPIGSVAMKTFSVGGKRIETRLFMRHDDGGWAGYTYEWNDDGKDATLLPAGKVKALGDNAVVGVPEPHPVHPVPLAGRRRHARPRDRAAQPRRGLPVDQPDLEPARDARSHRHVRDAARASRPPTRRRLPDPAGKDPLEARARSYLHANCAHCHRPMGGGQGTMDLRYAQSLKDTVTCNATNTQGTVGAATKLIVAGLAGDEHRVAAAPRHRFQAHAAGRGERRPIRSARRSIDDWISSLTACP